jgi:beta-glucanase (GH16 family)
LAEPADHRARMTRTLRRLTLGGLAATAAVGGLQLMPSQAATIMSHARLIWHDEFTGPAGSRPNPHKWQVMAGAAKYNEELEYYSRSNVSLNGRGDLVITGHRQSIGGRQYSSGKLETLGRFHVRYGKIEARIKFPAGVGLWPAFFMLGINYPRVGWPDSGEVDAMEFQGQRPRRLVGTAHGPATTKLTGWQKSALAFSTRPFDDSFHVYGINWTRNRIVFTLDGKPYGTVTPQDLKPSDQWVFNRPYFFVLDMAIGGYWVGPPNSTTRFPARMLVDWVRVYS